MLKVVAVCAAALSLAACATVTRGTNDAWSVNTTPSGAAVRTSNQFACDATPCTFKMPRKSEFSVTITKSGYKTWSGQVTHKVSNGGGAAMAGNVVLGGLIGAGVDAYSGAMLSLTPNPLNVELEKDEQKVAVLAPAPVAAPAPAARAEPQGKTCGGLRVVVHPEALHC